LGCKYIEADFNRHGLNIFQEWKLLRYYKKIIKDIRPNVILTYTIKPNIYGALAARSYSIPVIANITGLGAAVENGGIMQKVSVALYKYAFRNITKVFFQNANNQQFFVEKKIAIGKHELIPGCGITLERFPLMNYQTDNIGEFVFISRIMKEKSIE